MEIQKSKAFLLLVIHCYYFLRLFHPPSTESNHLHFPPTPFVWRKFHSTFFRVICGTDSHGDAFLHATILTFSGSKVSRYLFSLSFYIPLSSYHMSSTMSGSRAWLWVNFSIKILTLTNIFESRNFTRRSSVSNLIE